MGVRSRGWWRTWGVWLAAGLLAGTTAVPAAAAQAPAPAPDGPPKVVLIVGPVGAVTERYRAMAEEAAAVAERYTPNVVRIYSPDATWPAVQAALDGASIVLYLGHGNGFPSRYRDERYPPTQNGFGLNPEAGQGDDANQYYGEGPIANSGVRLAQNAVVILSHLCYASGNTEPGLPEGTLDDAIQRVDNFGAGFLAIGAEAVLADAHLGPSWYIRQLLTANGTLESIWNGSPSGRGNVQEFDSLRSPGYRLRLDPDDPAAGYFRSMVWRSGLTAAEVRRATTGASLPPPVPTLAGRGFQVGRPEVDGLLTTGSRFELAVAIDRPAGVNLPVLMLGTRWTFVEALPAVPPELEAARVEPTDPTEPPGTPAPPPDATATPDQAGPGGSPVAVAEATFADGALRVLVEAPATPGIYDIVTTIHDRDGTAYDRATQKLVRTIRVRVSGPIGAIFEAPSAVTIGPLARFEVAIRMTNVGSIGWTLPAAAPARRPGGPRGASESVLAYRWVSLDGSATVPLPGVAPFPADLAPGDERTVILVAAGPAALGRYQLLIDVLTPRLGSLARAGVAPAMIPVTVVPVRLLAGA